MNRSHTLPDRLWSKIDICGPDECWPWMGTRRKGYGRITEGGKNLPAHRVAWELANGRLMRPGLCALHSCDNPPCCNPAHIRPGTHKENMEDAQRRGRIKVAAKRERRKDLPDCPKGHPLSGDNLGHTKRGGRLCKECQRATWRTMCERKRQRMAEKGLSKRGLPLKKSPQK